jgi:polyribonucleotide nucleotidyltransferase
MISFRIKPEKIRHLIGPSGKVIKGIVETTGCRIEVEDDGTVRVDSGDEEAIGEAITRVIAAIT